MKTTNSEELDVQWYGVKVLYKFLIVVGKPKEESLAKVLFKHYPEVTEDEIERIRRNYISRNRDFN
ncbi:hypothetical protein [Priestia megaterium]